MAGRNPFRSHTVALSVAAVLAIVVGLIATSSIVRGISEMRSPCVQWALDANPTVVAVMPEGCSGLTVHGQTRLQASVVSGIVPGGLLLSIGLFCVGVIRSRRRFMTAAAALMLAETLVVFTIFPLTLLTGITFAYLAYARS